MYLIFHRPPVIHCAQNNFSSHCCVQRATDERAFHFVKTMLPSLLFFRSSILYDNMRTKRVIQISCVQKCNTNRPRWITFSFAHAPETVRNLIVRHLALSTRFSHSRTHRNRTTCSHVHCLHLNRCTHSIEAKNVKIKF